MYSLKDIWIFHYSNQKIITLEVITSELLRYKVQARTDLLNVLFLT